MRDSERRARLYDLTAQAAARQSCLSSKLRSLDGQAPAPGELFRVSMRADETLQPVQWLVVKASSREDSFFVVPVDTFPAIGRQDLEVLESITESPLVVRCRYSLWVSGADLEHAERTGIIDPRQLDSVHRLCGATEVEAGSEAEELLGVDEESEYQDWLREVIVPSTAAFGRRGERTVRQTPPVDHHVGGFAGQQLLALAAALVLGVGIGLLPALWLSAWRAPTTIADGSQSVESSPREDGEAAAERHRDLEQRIVVLEQQLQKQELAYRDELSELESRDLERQGQLAALESQIEAANETIVAGLPMKTLTTDTLRSGAVEELEVPASAQRLAIVLVLDPLAGGRRFRLEVLAATGEVVVKRDVQRLGDDLWIASTFPRELLANGDYSMKLTELREGGGGWVGRYRLEIRDR